MFAPLSAARFVEPQPPLLRREVVARPTFGRSKTASKIDLRCRVWADVRFEMTRPKMGR